MRASWASVVEGVELRRWSAWRAKFVGDAAGGRVGFAVGGCGGSGDDDTGSNEGFGGVEGVEFALGAVSCTVGSMCFLPEASSHSERSSWREGENSMDESFDPRRR